MAAYASADWFLLSAFPHPLSVRGLNEALKDPEVKAKLADLGAVAASPEKAQPEALRALLRSEIDRWTPIIKKAGVYAE